MREFKFKAWDKITKQVCPVVSLNYEINSGELINIILSECNAEFVSRNIEDVVLMQYTGSKDMNGVEIYEGYIVKIPEHFIPGATIEQISFVSGSFVYGDKDTSTSMWCDDIDLEVIGNIYENPKLLE